MAKKDLPNTAFWTWWESHGRQPGGRNENWSYATIPKGIPSTNNSVEVHNRVFKVEKKYGFGRTVHLAEGMKKVQEMVVDWNNWHRCADVHAKPQRERVAIERIAWREAQDKHVSARLIATCVVKNDVEKTVTMFCRPGCDPASQAEMASFLPSAFSTWSKFEVLINGFRATILRAGGTGACTCRTWALYMACKHFFYLRALHGFGVPLE